MPAMEKQLYIGLMSGTSADGIDLALVDFANNDITLVAKYFQAYTPELRQQITALYQSAENEIDRAFMLDKQLAKLFASAINDFLAQQQLEPSDICAIGNHGQTIRHRPEFEQAFTLQIGCNQTLACLTGIRVIGDFRQKDMVLGGQGAPLVPAFHRALFGHEQQTDIFIVNIGGIANITFLPKDVKKSVLGFDTGPGNCLMDEWCQHHLQLPYDQNGAWAATGTINEYLFNQLMADNYFAQSAPKSTGREKFNLTWLNSILAGQNVDKNDVQMTLAALTATTITDQIRALSASGDIYLAGGGKHNKTLKSLINQNFTNHTFKNLPDNIDSDAFEAMAFAWLAYAYDKKIPSNIPCVTGAYKETTLGVNFFP